MSALREMIVGNINSFKQTPAMVQVIENLSDRDEKLIVLNNSSLLREKVTTTKSPKYLCFSAKEGPITSSDCFVVTGTQQNSDFKVIDKTDNKIKSTVSLDSALEVELQQLGDLVYVLIGKIEDTVVVEAAIEDEDYSRVVLNPSISNQADVGDGILLVRSLDDEDDAWNRIESVLRGAGKTAERVAEIKAAVARAFTDLRERQFAKLVIPRGIESGTPYFLDLVSSAIAESVREYTEGVQVLLAEGANRPSAMTEVLRIAYNFVDDALTLLRLISSVCDLKPILFWATFTSHFKLDEAIRLLPWSKQKDKPSLATYAEKVKRARNKAFHRLLPFSKTFQVALPENALREAYLRLFAEFGAKKNQLTYKDKALVDVLMEFTRTSQELVPQSFWEKNASVLTCTQNIVDETSQVLKECLSQVG